MIAMPSVATDTLRRAALFLLATCPPLCVGIWRGEPAGALLGCVCGLWFAFADDEGPLPGRFTILAMATAAIAIGGVLGTFLRGFPWPFWIVFALLTFAVGMLNTHGKAAVLSTRFGSIALVVAAGAPPFQLAEILYAIGTLAVVIAARLIDHAVFGSLVQQRGGAKAVPTGGWTRFSLAYAAAALVSLRIGLAVDPSRALWLVITTLLVMQPDARASYVRIVERIAGTVLGVVAAYAITSIATDPWIIAACAILIAPLIPHHLQYRYWLHTALIALLVLLAYRLATFDPRVLHGLFTERLQDVVLGGVIGMLGTMLAFPRTAKPPSE
jgi:uncharacterized membrane protein YccC